MYILKQNVTLVLSSQEHVLLWQKTLIQFPESTWCIITIWTPILGDLMSSSGFHENCMHSENTYRNVGKTLIQIKMCFKGVITIINTYVTILEPQLHIYNYYIFSYFTYYMCNYIWKYKKYMIYIIH